MYKKDRGHGKHLRITKLVVGNALGGKVHRVYKMTQVLCSVDNRA